MSAQEVEGLVHAEVLPFGDHALGLFDDHPAVEGVAELLVDELGLERGAVLENGDGGHVGQRLGGTNVGVSQLAGLDMEQVEAPITEERSRSAGRGPIATRRPALRVRIGASGHRPRSGLG